jgi:hypothetical protein
LKHSAAFCCRLSLCLGLSLTVFEMVRTRRRWRRRLRRRLRRRRTRRRRRRTRRRLRGGRGGEVLVPHQY